MSAGSVTTSKWSKFALGSSFLILGALACLVVQCIWGWATTLKGSPRAIDKMGTGYYEVVHVDNEFALVKSANEGGILLKLDGEATKSLPEDRDIAFLIVREDDGKRSYEWASPPEAQPTPTPAPPVVDKPAAEAGGPKP